jgi:Abnormal spindle-like microcephaly-assoc'd, ASPM-SPD-2-Hydin
MVGRFGCKCRNFIRLGAAVLVATGSFLAGLCASGNSATSTTNPAQELPALVQATPEAVSFVDVPVGETYTQVVRITNISEGVIQIKTITASNADFRVSGILLPVVVAPGTSESLTISYRAIAEGQREGQIGIVTSTGETALALKVRAVATVDQRELTASEAGIDFEDVAVGSSTKKILSLTNSGNRELRISGTSVSGTGFSVSGAGAVNLSPGQNITLDVNFTPKGTGRQAGSLVVSSAEGESLLEIPLSGTGAASSQKAVKLNWEESPVSVAGYVVYRAAEASGPYTQVSSGPVASTEYIDTGLAAGHTYYYVVTAVDANQGESECSAPTSATVPAA